MMSTSPDRSELSQERIAEFARNAKWYHTIQLRPGIFTSGTYDHKPHLEHYGFPAALDGMTVLDVGASDRFFSFELEQRGARSVLAVDTNSFDGTPAIDPSPAHKARYVTKYSEFAELSKPFADVYQTLGIPQGHQFLAARKLIGSRVEFRNLSIYDLPNLQTQFDLVFCGDLIEHLKNPLQAIESLAAVTGRLCIVSLSSALPDERCGAEPHLSRAVEYVGNDSGGAFFHFHPQAFREVLRASGFNEVELRAIFALPNRQSGLPNRHAIFHCWSSS